MPTLEERVAYLEGQVSEHSHDIRDSIRQLERRCDARFDAVDRRIGGLEEKFDRRIDALEGQLDRSADKSDRRIDGLEDKMSRQFSWLVGIQVTTLVAIVGALLARP